MTDINNSLQQPKPANASGQENDAGRTVLVGVLGGIISAAGYLVYQRLPDAATAKGLSHKQVLQKQAASGPRRIVSKKEGVSRGLPIPLGNQCAKTLMLAESIPRQIFRVDSHVVEPALKLGQLANHGPEQWRVMNGCGTNVKWQRRNSSDSGSVQTAQCRTGVASVPTHTQVPFFSSQVSTKRSRRV